MTTHSKPHDKRESLLRLVLDARKVRKRGGEAAQLLQRSRLADIVRYARERSPYYRELYRDLPEEINDVSLLPTTDKKSLMERFDDWSTDRDVTLAKARAFVEDTTLIGERFLGKYTVAVTSGTTGRRGIFLMDDRSLAVTNALVLRMLMDWINLGDLWGIVRRRGRMAMICATGGHFAEIVAAKRLKKKSPRRANSIQAISADKPLSQMVPELNRFDPAIVAPYASTAAILASEQAAGRLNIHPAMMVLSAEGLSDREYARIAASFQTKVRDGYAATECPFLSYSCEHGWKHVNTDWLVFEPVDADYRPVAAGTASDTVLITNLANRVQPILRYDLGDSILVRPDACPCGNPLMAIRVRGRSANVLHFKSDSGEEVALPPLVLELDEIRGIELSQIEQTSPRTLRVRLRVARGADAEQVWSTVTNALRQLLDRHRLGHIKLERATEQPIQSESGKYRTVIPYAPAVK